MAVDIRFRSDPPSFAHLHRPDKVERPSVKYQFPSRAGGRFMLRAMLLVALCGVAMLAPGPRIGLSLNVPEGGGEAELFQSLRTTIRLGLDGTTGNIKWDEFEKTGYKSLTDMTGGAKLMGQKGLFTISTIDTTRKRLQPQFANTPWTDPQMLSAFDTYLDGISAKLTPEIGWVSLGNEVDIYLDQHPDEVDGYIAFLKHCRNRLKALHPELPVGVTVTCVDGMKHPELIEKLQGPMDVAIYTYYGFTNLNAESPSVLPSRFDWMLKAAGTKKVLIQEIGYPASALIGGSEEKQALFVKNMFRALDAHADRIELAVYFLQYDFNKNLLDVFKQYYGSSDPGFMAYLSTLGLSDASGKPRLAWRVFVEEALSRRPILEKEGAGL